MKKCFCLLLTLMVISCNSVREEKEMSIKNIHVTEAYRLQQSNDKIIVLDVRTKEEFEEGHIEKAINIDIKQEDFESQIQKLAKDEIYIIHCRSGRRSTSGLEVMKKMSFQKIYHMNGGILQWEEEKLPLVKE